MTRSAARYVVMALVLMVAIASAASAQVITWSMADEYPATSIQGEADAMREYITSAM